MGCICSKGELQDVNPSIFFVTHACRFDDWHSYFAYQMSNMDNEDNLVKGGRLEVTATDIIFHQRDSTPINWPLRYLRRYGWDSELFSFESGRRAPTGTGIYAFKCCRSKEVFNLLQARFAAEESLANGGQDTSTSFTIFMPRRQTSTVDGYLEPVAPRVVPRFRTASSSPNGGARVRLDSVDSCSETQSPTPSTSTPTTVVENSVVRSESGLSSGAKQLWDPSEPRPDERNNNGHEYTNGVITSSGLRLVDSPTVTLDVNRLVETDNNHVYMNISPGSEPNFLLLNQAVPAQCFKPSVSNLVIQEEDGEPQHSYANLDLPEKEVVVLNGGSGVNYAVLDLDAGNAVTSPVTPTGAAPAALAAPPDSPNGQAPPTGYVTIDFEKTTALSNSVHYREATNDYREGRMTRHNSTLPPE